MPLSGQVFKRTLPESRLLSVEMRSSTILTQNTSENCIFSLEVKVESKQLQPKSDINDR